MVHLVDMNVAHHWPTRVRDRPGIGGRPSGAMLPEYGKTQLRKPPCRPSSTHPAPVRRQDAKMVLPVLCAASFCHLLNDMMQALLPAVYPILRGDFDLSFAQVGLLTFVYQLTASLFQPFIGAYTDRSPMPYSLPAGMASSMAGMLTLAFAPNYGDAARRRHAARARLLDLPPGILAHRAPRLRRLAWFRAGVVPGRRQFWLGARPVSRRLRRATARPARSRLVRTRRHGRHRHPDRGWDAGISRHAHARRPAGTAPLRHPTLSRRQVSKAMAVLITLAVLEIFLPGELHQLLHLLPHGPLRPLDEGCAALPVLILRGRRGRNDRRRTDRRPARPQARHLGLHPRRTAVHAAAAACRVCSPPRC